MRARLSKVACNNSLANQKYYSAPNISQSVAPPTL
jgi:hypothetical protein